jgi:glycosyltransferase involved in cell wall biosynthesis
MDYNNNFIDIKKKYNISTDYVFYPAQFWSHKNHVYILRAIKYLEKNYGVQLSAIFSGSDKGNKSHVLKVANNLGLANRVIFTGFVSNEEMPYLYRQALALTMPSYFGPTNLPPMEAFQLGVPVIYGDINGAKEQLGDAAILVDLKDEITFANALISLQNKSLRKKMIDKGHKQLEYINSKRDIADSTFKSILCEYKIRRQSWGK